MEKRFSEQLLVCFKQTKNRKAQQRNNRYTEESNGKF